MPTKRKYHIADAATFVAADPERGLSGEDIWYYETGYQYVFVLVPIEVYEGETITKIGITGGVTNNHEDTWVRAQLSYDYKTTRAFVGDYVRIGPEDPGWYDEGGAIDPQHTVGANGAYYIEITHRGSGGPNVGRSQTVWVEVS